jgi:hypothetical protein
MLFRIEQAQQGAFASGPEIYQGVQLGWFEDGYKRGYCIVISAMVGIVIDSSLQTELDQFAGVTWRLSQPVRGVSTAGRYQRWWENIAGVDVVVPVDANRPDMIALLTIPNPPPPPNRPSLVPGAPYGRGTLPPSAAHLPFSTTTEADEVFYRWESWPTSRRIDQVTNTVASWTFVSPRSEIPFAPTGFSAVSRMALPSFFPAMFRWRINPQIGSTILCGAVVPMFGQSGGGVEACFDRQAFNDGPIANPVVLPPL